MSSVLNCNLLCYLSTCVDAGAAHFFSVLARINIAYHLDIREKVKTIVAPTLIIFGADDHFTKKDSVMLKDLIPSSRLASLPGGHLAHVSSPKPFSSLVTAFVLEV